MGKDLSETLTANFTINCEASSAAASAFSGWWNGRYTDAPLPTAIRRAGAEWRRLGGLRAGTPADMPDAPTHWPSGVADAIAEALGPIPREDGEPLADYIARAAGDLDLAARAALDAAPR